MTMLGYVEYIQVGRVSRNHYMMYK